MTSTTYQNIAPHVRHHLNFTSTNDTHGLLIWLGIHLKDMLLEHEVGFDAQETLACSDESGNSSTSFGLWCCSSI